VDDVRERALDAAGKALARRALSRAGLEARLAGVAPPDVCAAVVSDLERLGYVDDEALALALAERRLASGWGPGRVEADLERLGVGEAAARASAPRPPRACSVCSSRNWFQESRVWSSERHATR
jgi:SOS response regulatory protein OraA/RecX